MEGSGSDASTGSTRRAPQPFLEGSCSGQGSEGDCGFFCSCDSCEKKSKSFSKAWSTHRMQLNEKKSKEKFVCEESVISTSNVSCFEKFCGLKAPADFCEGRFSEDSETLVSQFCGRMTVFKTKFSTFLNNPETFSPFSQFLRYSSIAVWSCPFYPKLAWMIHHSGCWIVVLQF